MNRYIRAILFDLGGTLMYARHPWEPIIARSDEVLAERLRDQGFEVPVSFAAEFRERVIEYYEERDQSLFETTYFSVVREMLVERGFAHITDAVIRSALDALFAVTQENWVIEEDALLTLKLLESAGYRMGLVSNAGDNRDVFQLVERFQIEPYFDFILTSAACSYRKPHPRIFELALSHWNLPAQDAVMVGDTLEADILGAQNAGLSSIWVTRRARNLEKKPLIQPDLSVSTLLEIPQHLSQVG
ncbi:MAG: HAD family hydrolase [Chloroflexi bacterium]|nr:HAD family hydrolase [Chloroflexota bacterium]